jgi:hypothetical protein
MVVDPPLTHPTSLRVSLAKSRVCAHSLKRTPKMHFGTSCEVVVSDGRLEPKSDSPSVEPEQAVGQTNMAAAHVIRNQPYAATTI